MKINNSDLLKALDYNLENVFNRDYLVSQLVNDEFQKIVLKQISIIHKIEGKKTNSKKWLDKLNEKITNKVDFIDINIKTKEEMMDEANYLKTYINNVYKIDITEPLEKSQKPKEEVAPIQAKQIDSTNASPMFGPMGMNFDPSNFDAKFIQDQFIEQAARQRLHIEMMNGTFYRYTSKPKIIPIMKYVLGFISILCLLTLVSNIIFKSLSMGLTATTSDGKKAPFNDQWYILLASFILLLLGYMLYMNLKPTKNDNIKYFFNWKQFLFIGLIWLIYMIIETVNSVGYLQIKNQWDNINDNSKTRILGMYGSIYSQFALMGLFTLLYITMIITSVFNPKIDIDRINKKLESIIFEMKNSKGKNV